MGLNVVGKVWEEWSRSVIMVGGDSSGWLRWVADTRRLSYTAEAQILAISWWMMMESQTALSWRGPSVMGWPANRGIIAGMRVTANGLVVSHWDHDVESGSGISFSASKGVLMVTRSFVVTLDNGERGLISSWLVHTAMFLKASVAGVETMRWESWSPSSPTRWYVLDSGSLASRGWFNVAMLEPS